MNISTNILIYERGHKRYSDLYFSKFAFSGLI